MKRTFVYLAALVGMAGAVYLAGSIKAQGPGGAGAAPTTPPVSAGRDVAVFNVAKVMKNFQKWQYFAAEMNKARAAETIRLGQLADQIKNLKAEIEKETVQAVKDQKDQQYRQLAFQYDTADREAKKKIDEQSSKHLKELHDDIKVVVEAVASKNGFGVVFAYPDATTEEEKKSPLYFELKLRPPAAMPFFVSPNCDITDAVVTTLNKYRPSPGPIATTGGTTPAPAGTTPPTGGAGGTIPKPGGK
ncbi:MAG TPA: OmpH family outer membrane protein [Fimbriiglobus sp.]